MSSQKLLTVTALTKYIKKKFEIDPHLQDIWFKGEISNFKLHSRGHMYFTLKDENARIQAVMFAGNNRTLTFKPENGMKVLVRGQIAVYEPMGSYQVYVKEMEPDGIGNLYLAYEELKKKLELEGLFDSDRKRAIPAIPAYVGVITSPTGAAVRDIFTTIKRRFPAAGIILIPALVQGDGAARSLVQAIERANDLDELDVLIVGRGGGSIEDLWPFNEEIVARAIFNSRHPVISAVGHETDFTIADFVADMRAPTPTGAGELAVPHQNELMERLRSREIRLLKIMKGIVDSNTQKLAALQKSYAFKYPRQMLDVKEQELDRVIDRLDRSIVALTDHKLRMWEHLNHRLQQNHPKQQIKEGISRHHLIEKRLIREFTSVLDSKKTSFQSAISQLNALSPLRVMERGFNVAYKQNKLVKSVSFIEPGDTINIELHDGRLDCQVWGIEEREHND